MDGDGMDIRQYEVYIDGVRLPRWFLTDADTQLGVRTKFRFDGFITRMLPDGSSPASPVYTDGFVPYNVATFAELGGDILSFRLRESVREGYGTALRLGSPATNTNMRWQVQGGEICDLRSNSLWELEWGEKYVIYADYHGARTQMTLEVRRCRLPLRDLSRARLNR